MARIRLGVGVLHARLVRHVVDSCILNPLHRLRIVVRGAAVRCCLRLWQVIFFVVVFNGVFEIYSLSCTRVSELSDPVSESLDMPLVQQTFAPEMLRSFFPSQLLNNPRITYLLGLACGQKSCFLLGKVCL
jgi:hypothetical protein